MKQFFGEIGFEILEVHPFSEMKKELYSINEYNLTDDHVEQLLDDAIVVVMKLK